MLSDADIRALIHVSNGNVVRVYRRDGNVLRGPKGVSAATLWSLAKRQLIANGRETAGVLEMRCKQVLTAAGRCALDAAN
jgi:hypothetical protein